MISFGFILVCACVRAKNKTKTVATTITITTIIITTIMTKNRIKREIIAQQPAEHRQRQRQRREQEWCMTIQTRARGEARGGVRSDKLLACFVFPACFCANLAIQQKHTPLIRTHTQSIRNLPCTQYSGK